MWVGRLAEIAVSSSAISSIMTACTSWIRSRFPSQSGRQKILVRLLVLFALQLTSCPRGCLSALPLLRLSSDLRWAHDGGIIPRDAVTNESVKPGLPFPSFCSSSRLLKKGKETAAVALQARFVQYFGKHSHQVVQYLRKPAHRAVSCWLRSQRPKQHKLDER